MAGLMPEPLAQPPPKKAGWNRNKFMFFCDEFRMSVHAELTVAAARAGTRKVSSQAVTAELGVRWRALQVAEQEKYEALSAAAKAAWQASQQAV